MSVAVMVRSVSNGWPLLCREVGGDDTAVVAALGNTLANVAGMIVPLLGGPAVGIS